MSVPTSVDVILQRIAALERSFEYAEMHPLYQTIKGFFCCDISSFLYTIWKDLTTTGRDNRRLACLEERVCGLGALSLCAISLGFLALHKIDKMPRVDCCGCTCRRRYFDDVLSEVEEIKITAMQKSDTRGSVTRKGTQLGTDRA